MRRASLLLSLALIACSRASGPPVQTTATPRVDVPRPTPTSQPVPTPSVAPRDWQLRDATVDGVPGVSMLRAERELLTGRSPARSVVVAVIDGGVDTAHVDLRTRLWYNAKEVAGNGRDDDNNGYVDDTFGWNFIGGKDGRNVEFDTFELARQHARCQSSTELSAAERTDCPRIATELDDKRAELEGQALQVRSIDDLITRTVATLRPAVAPDTLSLSRVRALRPTSDDVRNAQQMYIRIITSGITPKQVSDARKDIDGQLEYGLNPQFNPRGIVGDSYANLSESLYGNRDVTGPDAGHGTHVAGIIAADRHNATGIDGLADSVRIMAVRAVPNGDERDKDVANAIRYAVDNGAHIINMSFGKGLSPQKGAVDAAVRYADQRGVLIIHAAGNDGQDLETHPSFPTATYESGGRAANWIEVGASNWQGGEQLAAPFSNYGAQRVDVFAPGVDILSSAPGNAWEVQSGTSMAAPVVAGVAAMLMSYFPKLTAADVKKLILDSATPYKSLSVVLPGSDGAARVPFSQLSVTGGVVNAYNAVKAALATAMNEMD